MRKFLLGLYLVCCLFVVSSVSLQAAEPQKPQVELSVKGKEQSDEQWFQADTDPNEIVPSDEITMIPPRPSEIINSGLAEVSQTRGLIEEKTTAVAKPECQNPRLLQKVLEKIASFYRQNPSNSIIDKRRQTLMLKNLHNFQEVDIASFDPKENFAVSDQIISYKINKGLKEEQMRLCRSSYPRPIYLLIYPHNNFYTVEIINFPGRALSKNFTTVYD